jgi:AraC-like DNA-binding protein
MTKNNDSPFGGEQIIKNCIELLLISLLRTLKGQALATEKIGISSPSDDIVENITNILSEMLSSQRNISLDELSFRLNFSKSYIKSQFKKKTGYSIIQYYINMKIEKAKKLLSRQKYTVSEISDMLGFSSVYYFSRQFKLQTDMSPSEYVNSIKAENIL